MSVRLTAVTVTLLKTTLPVRRTGSVSSAQAAQDAATRLGAMKTQACTGSGWFPQLCAGQINREGRAFADPRVNVQRAAAFLDEPLDDIEAKAGPLPRAFGGEVRLKNFRQHFRRNPRAVVAHPEVHQPRGVFEIFHVQQPVLRAVLECLQI